MVRFLQAVFRFRLTSRLRRLFGVAIVFTLMTFFLYFSLMKNAEQSDKNKMQTFAVFESKSTVFSLDSSHFVGPSEKSNVFSFSKLIGSFKKQAAGFDTTVKKELHMFYYSWWDNTTIGGRWVHWNHAYIPPPGEQNRKPTRFHSPPEDVGANFYPYLGAYSSRDSQLIMKHMEWMKLSGADVVALSWYPAGQSDPNGLPELADGLVPKLLEGADKFGLKIAFHIEPFEGRNSRTMHDAISYLVSKYGNHSAMYKFKKNSDSEAVPLIYVYDSYLVADSEWIALLKPSGRGGDDYFSIRGTKNDAFVVGLCLKAADLSHLKATGFDGAYTYFAANGMTECSTQANWGRLAARASELGLLFIPSAGPGYDDLAVRPWNRVTSRSRGRDGETLALSLEKAITAVMEQANSNDGKAIVSLTSFNEWHEGTQIEPAKPYTTLSRKYSDYLPHDPFFYLKLTKEMVDNAWKHVDTIRNRAPLSARHVAAPY